MEMDTITSMMMEDTATVEDSQIQQQQQQLMHHDASSMMNAPLPILQFFDPNSGQIFVADGSAGSVLPVMSNPQQQQQQQLLQFLSQQQQQHQQQQPMAVQVPMQPVVVPIPALQQAVFLSPTTGAVLRVEPLSVLQQQQQSHHATSMSSPPHPIIHNLIPEHLQSSALAPSLSGTPGHQPALILPPHLAAAVAAANNLLHGNSTISLQDASTLFQTLVPSSTSIHMQQQQTQQPAFAIPASLTLTSPPPPPIIVPPPPALTVQDRPAMIPAMYNGVNPSYPGVQQVHQHPPVYIVDNFLSPDECDFLVHSADGSWTPAPVVGRGVGEISPSRTSSTVYLAREDVPNYMRKVALLTSKPVVHCELPQVGRYLPSQQYLHVSSRTVMDVLMRGIVLGPKLLDKAPI
jgi:hypothetical protein